MDVMDVIVFVCFCFFLVRAEGWIRRETKRKPRAHQSLKSWGFQPYGRKSLEDCARSGFEPKESLAEPSASSLPPNKRG